MEAWAVVFLGVIAIASLVQSVFLVGLAVQGRRLARRVEEVQQRFERDLRPGLESFQRIARNAAEVSDLAVLQARRVDEVVADTIEKVEQTTALIRRKIVRPLEPLADLAAFLKGLKRGVEVYQQLRGFEAGRRRPSRSYAETEDEHLFI